MPRPYNPYVYVSDALDQLFLLQQRCPLSVKQTGLLDKAEIALTELLDSVDDEREHSRSKKLSTGDSK